MNTPHPCDTCKHLYWDVLREDDPSYSCECKIKMHLKMGDEKCIWYEPYTKEEGGKP
jgi:hypothetical protein